MVQLSYGAGGIIGSLLGGCVSDMLLAREPCKSPVEEHQPEVSMRHCFLYYATQTRPRFSYLAGPPQGDNMGNSTSDLGVRGLWLADTVSLVNRCYRSSIVLEWNVDAVSIASSFFITVCTD